MSAFIQQLRDLPWLRRAERDHRQSDADFRRRQLVAAATLVVSAPVLRRALSRPAGSPEFGRWTLALAGVMTAGAFASGPLHLGRSAHRARPLVRPTVVGAGTVVVFAVGGIGAVAVPRLRAEIEAVVRHARYGDLRQVVPLALVTGVAEELFYRGALYAAVPEPHQVGVVTSAYTLTTLATGNPMLVFAAGTLGLVTGVARRVTGGVQSPMIIHAIWTLGMIVVLPPLSRRAGSEWELLAGRLTQRGAR